MAPGPLSHSLQVQGEQQRPQQEAALPQKALLKKDGGVGGARDCSGGAADGCPSVNAGDMGSIPDPGRFTRLWGTKPVGHNY